MVIGQNVAPQPVRPKRTVGSICREVFERTGGVIGAAGQVAGSLLPSTIVGATEGLRRAKHPDQPADPKKIALWVTAGTAAQALLPTAALGYWAAGWKGAAVALGGQGAGAATGVIMFARGGSADLVGKGMANDLNAALEGETNPGKATLKGLKTGLLSGAVLNAKAGYREGTGAFSGFIEGVRTVPESFRGAGSVKLTGSGLAKSAQVVAGAVTAGLAVPAGIVHGIVEGLGGSESYGLTRQVAYTAGGLAVTLASWPLAFGALTPALIAAGAGGAVGAVSALVAGRDSMEKVPAAVKHAQRDNKVFDDPISDRRQKMFEGAFAGAAVAAGVGWRKGAKLLGAT
ncbi:MAG: hypothetical protein AB7S38_12340 [Vulcanimicrobiota bacterium]